MQELRVGMFRGPLRRISVLSARVSGSRTKRSSGKVAFPSVAGVMIPSAWRHVPTRLAPGMQTTNVIRIDYELCNGCYACVDACEFHAAFVDPVEHVPLICDFCGGDPMCVKFCYKQAIQPDNGSLSGTENAADLR